MHPYDGYPDVQFWARSVAGRPATEIDYDPCPRFRFRIDDDTFATAGSCFAQHFGRELMMRGGRLVVGESRHDLVPPKAGHGYGLFSARYGNIYTTHQLHDLVDQAFGLRPTICEFAPRPDGRWVDMLRPRAVPDGFSSEEDARADRAFHLRRVRRVLEACRVFVFTLGLTELWLDRRRGFAYGLCPGVAGGRFDEALHAFHNQGFEDCLGHLAAAVETVRAHNPAVKVLLTVSPVMLVATAEPRGALQSSIASKAILRAVSDAMVRRYDFVDYFPSFEIVSGPQAGGRYYEAGGRDVTPEGVALVMDVFFRARMTGTAPAAAPAAEPASAHKAVAERVKAALEVECDEILLDKSLLR